MFILGTGMAGQELRKLGFTSIHASDMSTQILEQAKQKVSIFIFKFHFKLILLSGFYSHILY